MPESELDEIEGPYSITEQVLSHRLRHPHYTRVCRQLFAGCLAFLSCLSFGTCIGWGEGIALAAQEEERKTEGMPILLSIMFLGCSFGTTGSSFLQQQMGPKKVMQVIGAFYIVNWWLMLIPSEPLQMAGRFFLGFLGLIYSNSAELLLMHTVHPRLRRFMDVFLQSSMVAGVLLARVVGTVTTTFWLTVACGGLAIFHYVLIYIVPESPVYLFATSHAAAAKSLQWYRGAGNFYMDMIVIKREWDAQRQDSEAYSYMLCSRVVYRPLLIIVTLVFFQVTAAYFVFMIYSIKVMAHTCEEHIDALIGPTVVGVFFVLTKLFWGLMHTTHPKWRMRKILLLSCSLTAVMLTLFTGYLMIEQFKLYFNFHKILHYVSVPIICLYLVSYDMGLNYYSKVLVLEYMPVQMFKRALMISQAIFWLLSFLCLFLFTFFLFDIPTYIPFLVYTGLTYISIPFCYFLVVECKGKSLIQIQMEFGGNPVGRRGTLYRQFSQYF